MVNQVLGVIATMGQTVAEHTGLAATAGYHSFSADSYSVTNGLARNSEHAVVTQSVAVQMGGIPTIGAGAYVSVGDQTASYTDASHVIGFKHLGLEITWDPEKGLKRVTFNIGIQTPNFPIGIEAEYKDLK